MQQFNDTPENGSQPSHPSLSDSLRQAIRGACDNGRGITSIAKGTYKNSNARIANVNRFLKGWKGMEIGTVERLIETLGFYVTLHRIDDQPQIPDQNV